MNTQPTPISDRIVSQFRKGEAHSDGLILTMVELELKLSAICKERDELKRWTSVNGVIDLQRERDEARKDAEKAKAYKKVLKTTNANLKRERDEAVNNYETAQLLSVRVGEQRDKLIDDMKEIYNISSFDYETMPEAALRLYHGIVLEITDKARKHLTSNTI